MHLRAQFGMKFAERLVKRGLADTGRAADDDQAAARREKILLPAMRGRPGRGAWHEVQVRGSVREKRAARNAERPPSTDIAPELPEAATAFKTHSRLPAAKGEQAWRGLPATSAAGLLRQRRHGL